MRNFNLNCSPEAFNNMRDCTLLVVFQWEKFGNERSFFPVNCKQIEEFSLENKF